MKVADKNRGVRNVNRPKPIPRKPVVAAPAPEVISAATNLNDGWLYLKEGDPLRLGDVYDIGGGTMHTITASAIAVMGGVVPAYIMCYKPRRRIGKNSA
jgi:hypothetical protein